MTLEELLEDEGLSSLKYDEFIREKGFENVKKQDLERIIMKFGHPGFIVAGGIYGFKAAEETNRTMKNWTCAIGLMTLAIMVMTLIMTINT